ncbi:hypothetical protein NLG97_g6018 [Lecanicillium saksenae]|uniref:Uncharacterized protein n=1 Tax=Lecanicillium saksenae TaxID=468837 RepID=A0ACC1QQU9_9HYPO|nr:hypothetical protein NLG97_g6018 [Lecanicillium saksenae]
MKNSYAAAAVICALTGTSTCAVVANRETIKSNAVKPAWNSLGCYTDNVSGRALPYGATTAGGGMADALAAALQKRKDKVAKSDDEDDDDEW